MSTATLKNIQISATEKVGSNIPATVTADVDWLVESITQAPYRITGRVDCAFSMRLSNADTWILDRDRAACGQLLKQLESAGLSWEVASEVALREIESAAQEACWALDPIEND
jgi:hypothetical protein